MDSKENLVFLGMMGSGKSSIGLLVSKKLNIECFLLTIDIEKAFNIVDYPFLYAALSKIGFDKEFIDWIKVLNNGQESCIINGGESKGYFKLERG